MKTIPCRCDEARHKALLSVARATGTSVQRLFDDFVTHALAERQAEARFLVRQKRGHPARGDSATHIVGFLIVRPAAMRRWPTANRGSGGVLFRYPDATLSCPTRTMRSDLILPLIVGLGLCATGVHGLVQGRSGNPIVPVIWICLGAVSLGLFAAGVRRLGETVIARGRMHLDRALRGSSLVEIGPDVVGTRVVLRFADAVLRFNGLAEFEIVQDGVLVWQGGHKLRSMRPRQYRVPQWMPTSDAGSVRIQALSRKLECRAVAIDLPGKLSSNCSVGVRVELASNFKGFELDKWHPIAECEAIDIEIHGTKSTG